MVTTILVVEDIESVRTLIEAQLKLRGYQVVTARDGEEALALIAQNPPSAIVTDILMPRVDGFSLAHRLRLQPETADIPIIFLSATYVSAEDERFAMELGARRFLPKPVDADELFIAVADALTHQPKAGPAMSEREFYAGYRRRLEAKLRQKAGQIARVQSQLETAPEDPHDTYRRLLAEAQAQRDEIQRELAALTSLLRDLK